MRYIFSGCQNLKPNTSHTLHIKNINFDEEIGVHDIVLEPVTKVNWPVFPVMPDSPPEGKFGVGYVNIHNVYRNFNGAINFSYHHNSVSCR